MPQTKTWSYPGRCAACLTICTALALAFVAFSVARSVVADGEATILPTPQELDILQGDTDYIDIVMMNISGLGLYGVDLRIRYNPAVIEVIDADTDADGVQVYPGELLVSEAIEINSVNTQTGIIRYKQVQSEPIPPPEEGGILLTIVITGKAAGQESPITIEAITATNRQGATFPVVPQNGLVRVISSSSVEPTPGTQTPSPTAPPPTATQPPASQVSPSPTATPTPTSPTSPLATATRPPSSPTPAPPTLTATRLPATPTSSPTATRQATAPAVRATQISTPTNTPFPTATKMALAPQTVLPSLMATPGVVTLRIEATATPQAATLPQARANVTAPTAPAVGQRGGPVPLGAAPPVEESRSDTLRLIVGSLMILAGIGIGFAYLVYARPDWFRRRPTR